MKTEDLNSTRRKGSRLASEVKNGHRDDFHYIPARCFNGASFPSQPTTQDKHSVASGERVEITLTTDNQAPIVLSGLYFSNIDQVLTTEVVDVPPHQSASVKVLNPKAA